MIRNKESFHIDKIPLTGSCLIEASAGTGKTYSITLLVVRLLLERNIDVREILMVTFTNAAVAELDERIRKTLRQVHHHLLHGARIDPSVEEVIRPYLEQDSDQALRIISEAALHLDELSVFTIHGFAQQMLSEFAFETGQLFGLEILPDDSDLLEVAANKFWREQIANLPEDLLLILSSNGLNRSSYLQTLRTALRGYELDNEAKYHPGNTLEAYQSQLKLAEEVAARFGDYLHSNIDEINQRIASDRYASKAFSELTTDPEALIEAIHEKRDKKYVIQKFERELQFALEYFEAIEQAQSVLQQCIVSLYDAAIDQVRKDVATLKAQQQKMSYDDLIQNLHRAVQQSEKLREQIGEKFQAVFIDEFQDTDRLQYEIFDQLFSNEHFMLLIGDPKQSIYGFRGADLNTYLQAVSKVDHCYTMKLNFRSTSPYVADCNRFFSGTEDPFLNPGIQYEQVEASGTNTDNFTHLGEVLDGLSFYSVAKKEEVLEVLKNEISSILDGQHKIGHKTVEASDIAVLVRDNRQAAEVKKALLSIGIQSVNRDETRVLQTPEAKAIQFILEAIVDPTRSTVNRALLGPFTNLTDESALRLDVALELSRFYQLQTLLYEEGVYACLMRFASIYEVRSYLLENDDPLGQRSLSNFLQVVELMHQVEFRKKYSAEEILHWLRKDSAGTNSDDAFIQRIESDRRSLTISTIHSSKGLAYPIVFAPFLNLSQRINVKNALTYTHPESLDRRFNIYPTETQLGWSAAEQERENRRLLYVALTRAMYKSYVIDNQRLSSTFLHQNLQVLTASEQFELSVSEPKAANRKTDALTPVRRTNKPFGITIKQNWAVTSFSKLSDSHLQLSTFDDGDSKNDYERFIFSDIGRGPQVGNLLHDLLERIDFSNEESWDRVIDYVGLLHGQVYKEEHKNHYMKLLQKVSIAKMPHHGFSLSETDSSKKIPELEFYFKLNGIQVNEIQRILPDLRVMSPTNLQGVMNGFIDLFFEHGGKYYIIDWKSNYLGVGPDNYNDNKINQAMIDHNYKLQYHIYALAVHRYLQSKLLDYSYESMFGGAAYYFLRGLEKDSDQGIYFNKPDYDTILKLNELL